MQDSKTVGVIYILTNPSFPEYIKIGYANDVEKRIKSLNKSECIPFAFRLYAYYKTTARLTDLKIHEMIDRINPHLRSIDTFDGKTRKREFYAMSPEDGYKILETIAISSGTENCLVVVRPTQEEVEAEEEAEEIRTRTTLPRMDWLLEKGVVLIGDIIYYKKNPSREAKIVNENELEFEGKTMSFNEFAKLMSGLDHINQYRHLVLKREGKTLFELREAKMNEKGI